MSDIVNEYASNLEEFKLSGLISEQNKFVVGMHYDFEVNWKSLKQFWCSICNVYAINKGKKVR
jgi:hypothetical protein